MLYIICFSLCRDDEELPKIDTTTPSMSPVPADEPAEPAVAPRVTRATVKKILETRSNKRSKKVKEPDVSLEAHASMVSPNDVSDFLLLTYFFFAYTCALTRSFS
jgi:hypothetical protein